MAPLFVPDLQAQFRPRYTITPESLNASLIAAVFWPWAAFFQPWRIFNGW